MSRSTRSVLVAAIAALAALPAAAPRAEQTEVNVYSARKEDLIKPLLDRFTGQTGIKVNLVTGKEDALLTRLQSEGMSSPADLLVTTDAGRLHRAKAAGVTQAASSPALEAAIPASYRDPEGHWFGLSLRARPILYVKGKVDPGSLSTYEALSNPKWKGRICVRSSDSIYNQCGFCRTKSVRLIETILEVLKGSLESGEDVMLTRFGKFSARNKKARRGRNPATGKDLMLEPRRVVTFHCSPVLNRRLNGKG